MIRSTLSVCLSVDSLLVALIIKVWLFGARFSEEREPEAPGLENNANQRLWDSRGLTQINGPRSTATVTVANHMIRSG